MMEFLLLNVDGEVIKNYKIQDLPFKEEEIIRKSIELFSDPEPSIIHKTYVMKKMMFEIEDYLNKEKINYVSKSRDKFIFDYLELPNNIDSISIKIV